MSPTFDVQNPATGARVESVPNAGVRRGAGGGATQHRRLSGLARPHRLRALEDPAGVERPDPPGRGPPRPSDDRRDGQAHHRVARRGEVRRGVRRVVRRGGQARLRRDGAQPVRAQAPAGAAAAGGPGLRRDAVELSGGDGHAQGRAGAGRGLHGGAEARRAVAAHRDSPRGAVARGRRARRRLPGAHHGGPGGGVERVLRRSGDPQAHLHRQHRGRAFCWRRRRPRR